MDRKAKVSLQAEMAPDLDLPEDDLEDEVELEDETDLVDPLGDARSDEDAPELALEASPVAEPKEELEESIAAPQVAPASEANPEADADADAIVRAAKAMREAGGAQQAQTKRCLVVDDSRVIRKVTGSVAKNLGFAVAEAENGLEALAICKKFMPDLVITDWDMPEMDGLSFVTALRAIPAPRPPKVVFCTSKGKHAEIHAGISAGADDYIVKPFKEHDLKAKLEQLG